MKQENQITEQPNSSDARKRTARIDMCSDEALVHHVPHYVWMLQLLQERDLPDCLGREKTRGLSFTRSMRCSQRLRRLATLDLPH